MQIKVNALWARNYNILVVCLFLIIACTNPHSGKGINTESGSEAVSSQTNLQNNKALVMKFYEALNDTNWAAVKTMVDNNYKHYYISDTGFASIPWSGFEKGYRMSHVAFPDWKLTPIKLVAEDDYVSVLLNGKGTHLGNFAGISATKVKASTPIMLLHQIKNGKLVADWEIANMESLLKQLKKQ